MRSLNALGVLIAAGVLMLESTRRNVLALAEQGSLRLSAIGRPALREMQSLFDSGVVAIVRSGAGQALQVQNEDALEAFVRAHFPQNGVVADLPARATALRTMRNTKQARTKESAMLLLRALRPLHCVLDGKVLDAFLLTQSCGAVALVLDGKRFWEMQGQIALIENMECFLHAERMRLDVDAVIYTAGRLSGIALDYLADRNLVGCSYLHCPDYDPVGLAEYVRYRSRLHDRIQLYVPENLRDLLQAYGKPALLQGRNGQIMQALRREANADVRDILQMLDEANAGLEQEILIQQRLQ
jgi:hypothetical protein